MNGGNISGGQSAPSGSDTGSTENPKWQKRYQLQVQESNGLSDRLRLTRKVARERETTLIKAIKALQADNKKLITEVMILKVTLSENGIIDPTVEKKDA